MVDLKPAPPVRISGTGAEALTEEARQRHGRRWLRAEVLLAVGVLVAATATSVLYAASHSLNSARGPGRAEHPPAGARPPAQAIAGLPAQIVALTDRLDVVVLAARSGRAIRTLAANIGLYQGLPALTVSPSGVVYFDSVCQPGPTMRCGRHEKVFSEPLRGGPARTVAVDASAPAISPNGHLLAYVALTPSGSGPTGIVVRDLTTNAQRTWTITNRALISDLSWSPDDRRLSITANFGLQPSFLVLDTRGPGLTISAAHRIPLRPGVGWAGYLTARIGVGVIEETGLTRIVEVDATTGKVIRTLTVLRHHLSTGNAYDGAEGTIQANPTGRYLLIAGSWPGGSGLIFWWTSGLRHPAPLGTHIIRATWVPSPAAARPGS